MSDIEPVSVHIASSSVQLHAAPRRKRRAMKTNTYTLTASSPTVRLLPQSDSRLEGWITSVNGTTPVVFIAGSQADAAGQGGGAAQVNGNDTTPVPVNTTDAVWVSASAGFPVTVSVIAIYELEEQ